jgi:hypothetical protein
MGLTSWSGSRVHKRDVGTAKNYLDLQEIDTLNRSMDGHVQMNDPSSWLVHSGCAEANCDVWRWSESVGRFCC